MDAALSTIEQPVVVFVSVNGISPAGRDTMNEVPFGVEPAPVPPGPTTVNSGVPLITVPPVTAKVFVSSALPAPSRVN